MSELIVAFERRGGNETFSLSRSSSFEPQDRTAAATLRVHDRSHGWGASPTGPSGYELKYWRHHGPWAFELDLMVDIRPSESGLVLTWDGERIPELEPIFERALGGTLGWPILAASVTVRISKQFVNRFDDHVDSLLLLVQMMVSQLHEARQGANWAA